MLPTTGARRGCPGSGHGRGTVKQFWRFVRIVIGIGLVLVALLFVGRLAVSVAGREPFGFGLDPEAERGGCPGTPNCVSTYAETSEHAIEPIQCDADSSTAIAVFADAIETLPDVEQTGSQAWIVYSRIMRLPDDVRIDVTRRGIEVISASRLGSSDLGVNRRRVEHLRDLVTADERCQ